MSDIPEGANTQVAERAIAWEMVKKMGYTVNQFNTPEEFLAAEVDAYNRALRAIIDEAPIKPKAG